MGLRSTQIQRVTQTGHESIEEVTLEEINAAIKNRPVPDWIIEQTKLPIQEGEFTATDFVREGSLGLTTARKRLTEWAKDGKLTRVRRKRADGHYVWAYRDIEEGADSENQSC